MALREKYTGRVHVSDILPPEADDGTEEALLPEDILSTYFIDPMFLDECVFKIRGEKGSVDYQKVLKVLERNRARFSKRLTTMAARVKPMTMEVDYDAFRRDKRSREPSRAQSAARKIAIAVWIQQAIADNIIRPSSADAWSQLMLTPKSNGTWRFAIDYRALNQYTKAKRAPIPNIKRLLSTIGAQRPKFYAKMDLTSGFYQAPMDEDCMKYTAFITEAGLFEFTRASMGLLNAPWYFTGVMEREVFPEYIHKFMEIYIDDMVTWAQTIDELCDNLQKIFEALERVGMTLNPEKCEFGMVECDFVGHLLTESGSTFSPSRLATVRDFPLPETKGEMKMFLGTTGYLRDY